MADWGAFLQGLSHTTQQLPNLIQRAQALQQEAEMKQDSLAMQRFQYGISLMGQFKNRPEQQAFIYNNFVLPSLQRGKERGVITHDIPQLKPEDFGNDVVSKTLEELDGWTRLYRQSLEDAKKTGATTNALPVELYYQKINDTIGKALGKVVDESDIKRLQEMGRTLKAESAPLLYKNVPEEEKPVVASHMTQPAQKAFGVGEKEEETWGEPYLHKGVLVQKSNKGKIRQIVKEPTGSGSAELNNAIKMDRYYASLVGQAMNRASKEASLKYNLQPTIQIGPDGKPQYAFPNHPEAHNFFVSKVAELTNEAVKGAVKRGALTKDYLPAEAPPSPKANPQQTPLDTEAGLRNYLKSAGADDKYIEDYVKKAKAMGKIK